MLETCSGGPFDRPIFLNLARHVSDLGLEPGDLRVPEGEATKGVTNPLLLVPPNVYSREQMGSALFQRGLVGGAWGEIRGVRHRRGSVVAPHFGHSVPCTQASHIGQYRFAI